MNYKNINPLIELIYDAAIDPSKWTDLLSSLADFVEHIDKQIANSGGDAELLSVIPAIAAIGDQAPRVSIAKTLKSLTDVNVAANDSGYGEISEVNDVLVGHFARAIKIAKRLVDLDDQHEVVLSLLDRLPIALVLVDSAGKVIECNALADDVLSTDTGLEIKENIIHSSDINQTKLLKAIAAMSKHDPATTRGKAISLNDDDSTNSLMLFLAPLKHHAVSNKASVAIFISQRKSQPVTLPPELTEVYKLTEKEVQVTGHLIRGLSIKEISDECSVSQHTVRTQVKTILKKTETSRQAELVSLVFNGMGSFVNAIPDVTPGRRDGLLSKSIFNHQHDILKLSDGRHLAYQEYGDPSGEVVVHCHSVLGSRLERAFNVEEICKQRTVRLIVIDRPGFGMSDPDPEMSFKKWPQDLAQLMDELGLEKISITGYAMGGQYALACAHEIPERIKKISIISAGMPALVSADYEQMIPLYKMNTRLARHVPKVYKLLSSVLVKGVLNNPDSFFSQLSEKVKPVDRKIMNSPAFKDTVFHSMHEGFRQGGKSSSMEIVQLMHDWGFDLNNIHIPINIWHGQNDCHVPIALSKRFEENIKETQYFIQENQGHYLFFTHWDEILKELTQ